MSGANEFKAATPSGDGNHLSANSAFIETSPTEVPPIAPAMPELAVAYVNLGIEGPLAEALPLSDQEQWAEVSVGDVVVAKERPDLETWHEADVLQVIGDLLTLKWSGLPDSEILQRRTWQVAVLRRFVHRAGSAR